MIDVSFLAAPPPAQQVVHHVVTSYVHPVYYDASASWTGVQEIEQRRSRRDEFDDRNFYQDETLDEKLRRIRKELQNSQTEKRDQSTETVEYRFHSPIERPRSASGSRRPRSSSAGARQPWRPINQNDYPWRDAHLPAYRDATVARSQTPVNESRVWQESVKKTANQSKSYYSGREFVYRPKSEVEAKRYYTQTTGKDADREVYQALRGGMTTYQYKNVSTPHYVSYQSTDCLCPRPSTAHVETKTHHLKKVDSTNHHDLYASNHSSLHVIPKNGSTFEQPYMRILNAPVTYIH
jgi:hypothetical protein